MVILYTNLKKQLSGNSQEKNWQIRETVIRLFFDLQQPADPAEATVVIWRVTNSIAQNQTRKISNGNIVGLTAVTAVAFDRGMRCEG